MAKDKLYSTEAEKEKGSLGTWIAPFKGVHILALGFTEKGAKERMEKALGQSVPGRLHPPLEMPKGEVKPKMVHTSTVWPREDICRAQKPYLFGTTEAGIVMGWN